MTTCPTCGRHNEPVTKRGDLVVQASPPGVWWQGSLIPGIRGYPLEILRLLCERGEASHAGLEIIGTGPNTMTDAVKVHLHRLRRRLPRGITITNIHGWGYRLKLENAA